MREIGHGPMVRSKIGRHKAPNAATLGQPVMSPAPALCERPMSTSRFAFNCRAIAAGSCRLTQ